MNTLFWIVIGIFAIGLIWGIKAGFVKVVYSLISVLLIVILTILVCPLVQDGLLKNEKVYNSVYSGVEGFVDLTAVYNNLTAEEKKEVAEAANTTDTSKDESYENAVDQILEKLGLPSVIRNAITEGEGFSELMKKNADELLRGKLDSLEVYVCKIFTKTIINALGFIITFVAICLVVFIVCRFLDLLTMIPVIREVNKLAGIAAGLLEALLVIWLLFALITTFGYTEFGQKMLSQINDSEFLSILYRTNIFSGRIFRNTMNV